MSNLVNIDVGSVAGKLMDGLDSLFTSDEEREQARQVLERIRQKPHLLQAEITLAEAQHRSVFVAGWRPSIGWVCSAGLAFQFLVYPFAGLINAYLPNAQKLPQLDAAVLVNLVLALLGLGGLRTYEKMKGVSK